MHENPSLIVVLLCKHVGCHNKINNARLPLFK